MLGDLPPSSSETGMILSAATRPMARPVAVPPVNVTFETPGWATSAAPVTAPVPGSTDSRPFGRPASSASLASSSASSGVNSDGRSEEHTSELQSLMLISYAVFCLKKKNKINTDARTYTDDLYITQQ